ncbi:septin-7 isoform X6 [Macrobrachium rosenbergii]|uniref:septin-7 isoform X6 n=1 Tax=Macrobrachium rosenbergii TaxID=79674 RepID=UPI0034D73EC2
MNGEAGGDGGGRVVTSQPATSFLRTGSTPTSYSSSPRLRRLDEMKKSYLGGGGGIGSAPNPVVTTTATYNSTFSSKYSSSSGNTYRLASLDRLAQRHKLYDANGVVNDSNSSSNANSANSSPITTPRDTPRDSTNLTAANHHTNIPAPVSQPILQSKREMFFKSEGGSGGGSGGGGPGGPLSAPSTAPPAPPVTSPATAPPPPPTATTTSTTGTTQPASVASIKEQLLTPKERKEHKDEENKENKLVKEMVKERRPREVDGYVGFANLPNQVYRKAVKRGFEFSLMVVGESGLGKSTLINSMFLSDIYSNDHPGPSHRVKKTVAVETTKVLLKENGVNLMLTVVDTPGFGDAVDNSDCWQPVTDYVENKYEEYLNCESRVNRKQISDSRVHCCLYFIAPSGHGLKPLDVEFMRRLHDKVNIIPVISKADTLTPDECQHLKKQVLNEIAQHKIKIYEFPEEEGDTNALKMKQRVPFAVVGSNTIVEVDGKKVRGRKYPWGIVEVENMEHCDFIPLRNMLIRTHMQDLKDVTNNVHYENYRCRKLGGITGNDGKLKMSNRNPLAQMEEEKAEHTSRMKKMEAEMEQVFEMKVKEKMAKLNELEADLQKRNESVRKKLESDVAELDEERERFERDKKAWEAANGVTVEELRRKSLESISRETSRVSLHFWQH